MCPLAQARTHARLWFAQALAAAIGSNAGLTSLDLSTNGLRDGAALAASLRKNRRLSACCLLWNRLSSVEELAMCYHERRQLDGVPLLTMCSLLPQQLTFCLPRSQLTTADGVL